MVGMTFDINGAEWTGWAEVFAFSAADAARLYYAWYFVSSGRVVNQEYCAGRAAALTESAVFAFGHKAALCQPYGMADMDLGLLFFADLVDGTGRANLAASCAAWVTVSAVEVHLGLHEGLEFCARCEHFVGALAYAELACCAMLLNVCAAERAGWFDWSLAVGGCAIFDYSQAAIHFHLLCFYCHSCSYSCRGGNEFAF